MDFSAFLTFTIALAIAAAIPGPGIAAIVGKSLGQGFRSGLVMVCGVLSGDVIYFTCAVLGLAFIANSFAGLFLIIKWLGVAYLLYLAFKFWTVRAQSMDTDLAGTNQVRSWWKTYLAGLSVTLGNPKTITFYLALTPTLIDIPQLSLLNYVELVATIFVVLMLVLSAYAALAARARATFSSAKAVRRLYRVAGTFLAGAAAGLAVRS